MEWIIFVTIPVIGWLLLITIIVLLTGNPRKKHQREIETLPLRLRIRIGYRCPEGKFSNTNRDMSHAEYYRHMKNRPYFKPWWAGYRRKVLFNIMKENQKIISYEPEK